jgi:hypothetical protein
MLIFALSDQNNWHTQKKMLNKPFGNKLSGIEVITIEEHSPVGELLPVKAVLSNSVNKLNLEYIRGEKTTNATSMFRPKSFSLFSNLHFFSSLFYIRTRQRKAGADCLTRRDLPETNDQKLEPP